MRIVTANELQDWLSQGELLEKDSRGAKVVRLPDGGDPALLFRCARAAGTQIRHLEPNQASLEEAFLRVVGEDKDEARP